MHMHSLNWLPILVAAISTMVVGFLWYSPLLFAKSWMREMGYDPNDKARMEEMKKNAGPAYGGSFVASLLSAFTFGSHPPCATVRRAPYRLDAWVPCLARICGHRSVHRRAVREAEHEALCHQHGLPTRLLSRHGHHPDSLEVAGWHIFFFHANPLVNWTEALVGDRALG
jgi:hypothetical protein